MKSFQPEHKPGKICLINILSGTIHMTIFSITFTYLQLLWCYYHTFQYLQLLSLFLQTFELTYCIIYLNIAHTIFVFQYNLCFAVSLHASASTWYNHAPKNYLMYLIIKYEFSAWLRIFFTCNRSSNGYLSFQTTIKHLQNLVY